MGNDDYLNPHFALWTDAKLQMLALIMARECIRHDIGKLTLQMMVGEQYDKARNEARANGKP
jgi:hypothetical protein